MSDPQAKKRVSSERPKKAAEEPSTVRPPFDPESFARESDSKIRIEATPASARPTAPPPPGLAQYAPGLSSGLRHALGSVSSDAVPELAVAREDLEWFELAPYARALLRYVDGRQSIDAICERACLKVDEVMESFHDLARDGLVTLRR